MKIFATILSVFLFSTVSFATSLMPDPLEGSQFCRTIQVSTDFFNRPASNFSHCVYFFRGNMKDNANTFFGNPPSTKKYKLSQAVIYVKNDRNGWEMTEYKYQDGLLTYNGIEMELVPSSN
jgi:hypothetical protein